HLKTERTIGPGGRNIFEEQYVNLGNSLAQKQNRIGELSQQLMIAQTFPKADLGPGSSARDQRIAQLELQKKKCVQMLKKVRSTARIFNRDPAALEYAHTLDEILDELDELRSIKTEMASNPTEAILNHCRREFEDDKAQLQATLEQMQESMPMHQKFLSM